MRPYQVDVRNLPAVYPTHLMPSEFWENVGRTVASFGFLEDVLLRAIVALTYTREVSDEELKSEISDAAKDLKMAVSDSLSPLIDRYVRLAKAHQAYPFSNLSDLEADLRSATKLRNVIAHGSWQAPDSQGRSVPHFVNRQGQAFETPIDIAFLHELQKHTAELAAAVVNSITLMGWAFPGTSGPGRRLLDEPR